MGFSWWIHSMGNDRDVEAWTLIDDFSWVLSQMCGCSGTSVKRVWEDEMQDALQRKR